MQLAPSPALRSIVRHYLTLSNGVCANTDFRIFSDGSPGIVFHRKNPFIQKNERDGNLKVQPECFVYGQISQFNTLSATGEMDMFIVVLQPSALFKLFKIAAVEMNDQTIPFTELTGHSGNLLIEKVQTLTENAATIAAIEAFLFNRFHQNSHAEQMISFSIQQICAQKGMNSMAAMLKNIPASERQLERKFREHIGLSPKKFADIIRFQNFLKCFRQASTTVNLSELSYFCGYYDQAHLNNCFKKFTGLTPLQYQTNNHLLTVNFLLLS